MFQMVDIAFHQYGVVPTRFAFITSVRQNHINVISPFKKNISLYKKQCMGYQGESPRVNRGQLSLCMSGRTLGHEQTQSSDMNIQIFVRVYAQISC